MSHQNAQLVAESYATGVLQPILLLQTSLENFLSGEGISETLPTSQGTLEIFSYTKGILENRSSPEMSVKPPTCLQDSSRPSPPSLLIQGLQQHPLNTQGSLRSTLTGSAIQGPLSPPEAGGNLSRAPGSWKSCPLTLRTLDHLQSAEGPHDLSIS